MGLSSVLVKDLCLHREGLRAFARTCRVRTCAWLSPSQDSHDRACKRFCHMVGVVHRLAWNIVHQGYVQTCLPSLLSFKECEWNCIKSNNERKLRMSQGKQRNQSSKYMQTPSDSIGMLMKWYERMRERVDPEMKLARIWFIHFRPCSERTCAFRASEISRSACHGTVICAGEGLVPSPGGATCFCTNVPSQDLGLAQPLPRQP